ncbi:MAG: universal stress protein [Elusimicrobiota bacterium]
MKRFPPKRILVAADLSAPSLSGLDAARTLAEQWSASLEIVYVENTPALAAMAGYEVVPVSLPPVAADSWTKVEEKLRKAAAGFPAERLKLRTVPGWPPAAILELASPRRADFMVMGTHGYAGLDRLLTGSISEAVIRRAHIPVLAVPERKGVADVTRVLAPWNGRPYATRALRWAREMARSLCATLDVFHVREPGLEEANDEEALEKNLVALLGAGCDWTLRTRKGDARSLIVAEANSGRYELVVLSAHRRPFAADFVLGSTIERVMRHSKIPVLAVPSGRSRPRLRRIAARAGARLY